MQAVICHRADALGRLPRYPIRGGFVPGSSSGWRAQTARAAAGHGPARHASSLPAAGTARHG